MQGSIIRWPSGETSRRKHHGFPCLGTFSAKRAGIARLSVGPILTSAAKLTTERQNMLVAHASFIPHMHGSDVLGYAILAVAMLIIVVGSRSKA